MTKFLSAPFPPSANIYTAPVLTPNRNHATPPRQQQSHHEARARTCMYYVYEPHACVHGMDRTRVFSPPRSLVAARCPCSAAIIDGPRIPLVMSRNQFLAVPPIRTRTLKCW
jgi:hypothetical protein